MKLSRQAPNVSHLFFADDLILLAEASIDQIQVVMECLDQFCTLSGQKVSLNKSSIFFLRNVETTLANNISSLSQIPTTSNLDRYLGAPSITGRL